MNISFPKNFSENTINFNGFEKLENNTYKSVSSLEEIWIKFPKLSEKTSSFITIFSAIIVGIFLLLFAAPRFRRRSLKWSIFVLLLAVSLLVILYFTNKNEPIFRISFGGSIPIIIFILSQGLYSIIAKMYLIEIYGTVTRDNQALRNADVKIYEIIDNKEEYKNNTELKENREYVFRLFYRKNLPRKFILKASYNNSSGDINTLELKNGYSESYHIPIDPPKK